MTTLSRIQIILATLALALAFGIGSASADQKAKVSKAKVSKAKSASTAPGKAKVKVLTFGEGDDVEGGVVGPNGENVSVRQQITHSSLIRVRTQFVAEIFKSAEDM